MMDEERKDVDRSVPENSAGDAEAGAVESDKEADPEGAGKYPEWDRLQDDVARQIRANRRFLERCLDDDFPDEEEGEEEEDDTEDDAPVG